MKAVSVQTNFYALKGGLDISSPATMVDPGRCIDSINYEPDSINGGYARMKGFERYDGRPGPTANANYWTLDCTITGSLSFGQTLTGQTSGATGKILQVSPLVLGRVTGTYADNENLRVSGVTQAIATSVSVANGASDVTNDSEYRKLAADDYRADIQAVPGSGPIRGIHDYNDVTYVWRDNVGGTEGVMYKSTASGWSAITLLHTVPFTLGAVATPAEGATLTQGGVTATVRRIVKQSGAWTGTALGVLVISAPSGGNFAAGAATIGTTTLTLGGVQVAQTFPPGGRYECVNYNFTGSTSTLRMYCANGVGKAFEFDGTYLAPITTGMATDTPLHLACHKNQLFLSFKGSVQNSGIGDPYAFSVVLGASEIAVGDDVTGLLPQPGDASGAAMSIFSKSSSRTIYGNSTADFKLITSSPTTGAADYTAQWIGQATVLSQRGIQQIQQTSNFGDFNFATVSGLIQPLINRYLGSATASAAYKERNQYRIFFNDGTALAMGLQDTAVTGFLPIDYGMPIRCYHTATRSDGREYCWFGSDDGYVYQDNVGTSFDGDEYESWLRLAFNHLGSPRYRKRFRRCSLDMVVENSGIVRLSYELGAGNLDVEPGTAQSLSVLGSGGYWDQFTWDKFVWDAPAVTTNGIALDGTEKSISMLFYAKSAIDGTHSVQGIHYDYSLRRLER
jgi:hypothetical protein